MAFLFKIKSKCFVIVIIWLLYQVFVGMSLRTYLDAAWKDGKAPIDPSTLVINVWGLYSSILPNLLYLVAGLFFFFFTYVF